MCFELKLNHKNKRRGDIGEKLISPFNKNTFIVVSGEENYTIGGYLYPFHFQNKVYSGEQIYLNSIYTYTYYS